MKIDDAGLRLTVYDKTFAYRGDLSDPVSVKVTPRHLKEGTAEIVIDSDHRLLPELMKDGARVVIRDVIDGADHHLLGGYVEEIGGTGPELDGTVTVNVTDDFVMLKNVLAWVRPSLPIDQQGTAGTFDGWGGNAEGVLKQYVTRNMVQRLGMPITVAPSLSRGGHIEARLRFQSLYDGLIPATPGANLTNAGIGITIIQSGNGWVLDVYEPSAKVRTFSESSGVVVGYKWSRQAMSASRVVIGGAGEAQLRVLRTRVDAARETANNRIIERFVDANDLAAEDAALLQERGQAALDEGRATSGLSLTLSETAAFRYGKAVRVGDQVSVSIGPTIIGPDVLTEASIEWTREEGLVSTPTVGDVQNSADATMANAVSAIARKIRTDQSRR